MNFPEWPLLTAELACGLPIAIGSAFSLLAVAYGLFWLHAPRAKPKGEFLPPVSVLKPLFGLDKNLHENLRSMCAQDYPDFQIVLAIQRPDDPAIPVAREIVREFGEARVALRISDTPPKANGKVENLIAALPAAKHSLLVISDSDIHVPQGYLRTIVAPLADLDVGAVCTLYRGASARHFVEKLELLSFNADFLPELILARRVGLTHACLGASTAIRRETLDSIGGFPSLVDYLAEDAEMGRRIHVKGLRNVLLPVFVDTMLDLPDWQAWWEHQTYWDQNARYVQFFGFLALPLLKAVPFALLFALMRGFDPLGLSVFAATLAVRLITAGLFLTFGAKDAAGLRALALLPLRDIASVGPWFGAVFQRHFTRRGASFDVSADGKIVGVRK
jgi:ceramide glucosyltransferase